MVLVTSESHAKYHKGGVDEFITWASKVAKGEIDYDKLNAAQKKAFNSALIFGESRAALRTKLAKEGFDLLVKHMKEEAGGATVKFALRKGKNEIMEFVVKSSAKGIVAIAKKGGTIVSIAIFLATIGPAIANGASPEDLANDAARDVAWADVVEPGFKFLVVDGQGTMYDYLIDEEGIIWKVYGPLKDSLPPGYFESLLDAARQRRQERLQGK